MHGSRDLLTFRGAVIVPAGQAAVTALAVGVTVGSLSWYFDGDKPLAVGALASGASLAIAWLLSLGWWRARVSGLDLAPIPARVYPTTVRAEVIASDPSGAYIEGRYCDFTVSANKLRRMGRRISAGVGFSHAGLAGPHKPLSRSEFEALRDEFVARGLAVWRNPEAHGQGLELTAAGRAMCRRFAELPEPGKITSLPHRELIPNRSLLSIGAHAHTRAHAD